MIVSSVDEAMERINEVENLDAVILGVETAQCDGYTECLRLARYWAGRQIPILLFSNSDRELDPLRALECGAVDVLTGPLPENLLLARLRVHVGLKRQRDLLERMATLDALTGMANHRKFEEMLTRHWRHAARYCSPISIILLELVKPSGQELPGWEPEENRLIHVAEVVKDGGQRPLDVAARLETLRFGLLLPETEHEGAIHVARVILESVSGVREACPGTDDKATAVCIGVYSASPEQGDEVSDFLGRAETALREARESGPNTMKACFD